MDDDRWSRVYVQPEIEGYLDKKETGVFAKKSPKRLWCWVQGSIFYQQKQQTNNNGAPPAIDVLDMSDVQSVRKVSADTSETQFEIVHEKRQVYICSDRKKCAAWIQALQNAMAIKGSCGQPQGNVGSRFYTDDRNVYAEIPDGNQNISSRMLNGHGRAQSTTHRNSVDNVYATPKDATENEYCVVSDLDKLSGRRGNNSNVPDTSIRQPTLPPPPRTPIDKDNKDLNSSVYDVASSPGGSHSNSSVYNEACSTGPPSQNDAQSTNRHITGSEEDGPYYTDAASAGPAEKQGKFSKKDGEKSGSPKPCRPAPVAPHVRNGGLSTPATKASQATPQSPLPTINDPNENANQAEDSSSFSNINSEDLLADIFNSMTIEPNVLELEYIITNDDAKPVADLKTFLMQNDVHCRLSTNRLSRSQDPIASCKSFLSNLEKELM